MADDDQLPIVARNLKALIGTESVNSWAKRHKLTQTTINRIKTGKMDPTVSFLEKIADAVNEQSGYHLSAWSLMVEGFDPKNPPVILRAGSPELQLYEIFEATKKRQEAATSSGGDHWLGSQSTPRRRSGDA
jgi:transcriptional regulator with XRE-family HTH domain